MSDFYSWIYVDFENNFWKFTLNENKELCYKISYREGKQTKEGLIDQNLISFSVYVENDGKIHIIYSNTNGQIKYCTFKENKWYGRTLYLMDCSNYKISNIKIEIIGEEMHIFYLMIEKEAQNYGVLIHSIWNGKETRSTKLSNIALFADASECYVISVDRGKNIDLLFITEEETGDISLNYCSYKNYRWTRIKRLYSIQGNDIAFELLNDQKQVHILNRHKEEGVFYLDHIRFEPNGTIQKHKIYESRQELEEPLIFRTNDTLYVCWLEENKIFHSAFDGLNWSMPNSFSCGNEHKVKRYRFYIACENEAAIKERDVYGAGETDMVLFFPREFVASEKIFSDARAEQTGQIRRSIGEADQSQDEETLRNMKLQLHHEKTESTRLRNMISSFDAQLQQKQNEIDTYKEKITKLLDQKKNTDENCDMLLKLQQNMQTKLEFLNVKVKEGENERAKLDNLLKDSEEEKQELKRQTDKMTEEIEKLSKELEIQRNKSIMERLLKM